MLKVTARCSKLMQDLSKNIYDHGPARSNGQPSKFLTFFISFDLLDVFGNYPFDFVCVQYFFVPHRIELDINSIFLYIFLTKR